MNPGVYFISFFMTHFQVAATIGLRDRRFSLHPTVVLNAILWNQWPADDAAGGNSTWLGNKMRVIGAAGKSGRYLWPLINMGGGGGGQVMLIAGREKVHFHGMPDRINTCLASEFGQSRFRIGRDEENGAILEGQRNTEVYLSAAAVFPKLSHSNSCERGPNWPLRPRRGRLGTLLQQLECGSFGRTAAHHPLSAYFFFLEYPCHGHQFCLLFMVKKILEQQGKPFPHAPECMK